LNNRNCNKRNKEGRRSSKMMKSLIYFNLKEVAMKRIKIQNNLKINLNLIKGEIINNKR
jgi:hypothetical protein